MKDTNFSWNQYFLYQDLKLILEKSFLWSVGGMASKYVTSFYEEGNLCYGKVRAGL